MWGLWRVNYNKVLEEAKPALFLEDFFCFLWYSSWRQKCDVTSVFLFRRDYKVIVWRVQKKTIFYEKLQKYKPTTTITTKTKTTTKLLFGPLSIAKIDKWATFQPFNITSFNTEKIQDSDQKRAKIMLTLVKSFPGKKKNRLFPRCRRIDRGVIKHYHLPQSVFCPWQSGERKKGDAFIVKSDFTVLYCRTMMAQG